MIKKKPIYLRPAADLICLQGGQTLLSGSDVTSLSIESYSTENDSDNWD